MSGVIKIYTVKPVGCCRTIVAERWLGNLCQLVVRVVVNYKPGVTPNQPKMFKFVLLIAPGAAAKN
ncbi:hypothetical protein [Pontibacter populi]|uniref:hypothetical protein n=1 Tax=Pontibacter populi TaxID=890055 RepID=UPI0033145536